LSHAFFIILIVAIVIGIMILGQIQADRRRRALAAWGSARGLEFFPARDSRLEDRYPFACLKHGESRYADNRLQGRIGDHSCCAFDYHYETSDGKNRTRHEFSAVILATKLPLKPLVIRPEHLSDRFVALLGFAGIEFESEAFNRQFHVSAPDRRWAFDVLPQATLEFLLDSPRFCLECQPCQIIAYRETIFQPAEFESAVEVIEGILSRLPKSLVEELQENEE
jgi:hypothetical protein